MLNSPVVKVMSSVLSGSCSKINATFYDFQGLQSSRRDLLAMTREFSGKLRGDIEGGLAQYQVSEVDSWVICPIDDMLTFSRGIPIFCSFIAASRGGRIFAAVIMMPIAKEVFFVEESKGAFLEDISGTVCRLRVSLINTLPKALIGFSRVGAQAMPAEGEKRLFTSGLGNAVYVASGRMDACIINGADGQNSYTSVGELLITESKGRCYNAGDLWVGSNGFIHDHLLGALGSKQVG